MINLMSRKITNGYKTARFEYGWDGDKGPVVDLYVGKRVIRLVHIAKP